MTPDWRGHCSLPSLSATALALSQTLEGLFELIQCPSRSLDSPRALLPELQRYKDTVTGVPRQTQRSQDTVNNN